MSSRSLLRQEDSEEAGKGKGKVNLSPVISLTVSISAALKLRNKALYMNCLDLFSIPNLSNPCDVFLVSTNCPYFNEYHTGFVVEIFKGTGLENKSFSSFGYLKDCKRS